LYESDAETNTITLQGESVMAGSIESSPAVHFEQRQQQAIPALSKPPEIVDLLPRVQKLLHEDRPAKALELIARAKTTSPWAKNAVGVCQLRLGNAKAALDVLRGLVLGAGGIEVRGDVPAVFKTNFAAALLLSGNLSGCVSVLEEVGRDAHPAVGRLQAAIKRWKRSLTFWQKANWYLGGQPEIPVALDFPPGDLE
jgi:hypothetical protein